LQIAAAAEIVRMSRATAVLPAAPHAQVVGTDV
jgi:hypothetical protein